MDKPIARRRQAQRDILDAIDYYRATASQELALRFVDALQDAADRISEFPAAGSPRFWDSQGLSGLRSTRVAGFPYLIFYVEEPDRLVVWRVLHTARDIPESLRETTEE